MEEWAWKQQKELPGKRLATESAGSSVTTFGEDEVLSCGLPPPPYFWSKVLIPIGLPRGVAGKVFIQKSLDSKVLKRLDLRGRVGETGAGREARARPERDTQLSIPW